MNINLIGLIVAVLFIYSIFTYFIIKKKTKGYKLAFDLKFNECKIISEEKNKECRLEFSQKIKENKLISDQNIKVLENKAKDYSSLSEALVEIKKDISKSKEHLHEENQKITKAELNFVNINNRIDKANDKLSKTINDINTSKNIAEKFLVQLKSEVKEIQDYKSGSKALLDLKNKITSTTETLNTEKSLLAKTKDETRKLQELKNNADEVLKKLELNTKQLEVNANQINQGSIECEKLDEEAKIKKQELHQLMSKIDLYVRLDDFVEYGFFEEPEYLYETSLRFAEEIKRIRGKQKELIKNKAAVTYPESTLISDNKTYNNQILGGQVKLMLAAFNIECDTLISKISPSNFSRTLERIDNLATTLEKSAATLFCGFNSDYVELKFEECKFQY